jgi:glucose/arabinose dehydrogenase
LTVKPRQLQTLLLAGVLIGGSASCDSEQSQQEPGSQTPSSVAETTTPEEAAGSLMLEPAFGDLLLRNPLDIDELPGEDGQYLVSERAGAIKLVDAAQQSATVVADLEDRVALEGLEMGLFGLALTPRFEETGEFLVYYSAANPLRAVLSRLRLAGGSVDTSQEEVLLEEPFSDVIHWGGGMEFGPDGYLYLGIGDGGPEDDPNGNAQNLTELKGSILRLAIEGSGYAIPQDNPFADGRGRYRPEIWAYGLRNPWRLSFDSETGDLWAGDVGEDQWEEINIIVRGANYGWNIREGADCFRGASCNSEGLVDPLTTYPHDPGCAIIGGFVYHGEIGQLQDMYIFSDFCAGSVWSVTRQSPEPTLLAETGELVYSIGEDADGEVLIMTAVTVYRLVLEE